MEGRTHVCLICGNAKSTHPDFVYHRFPKENQRCNLWKSIVSIPRITEMTVEKLRRNYQICSRHFSPKHYMTGHFKSKLMHDAYPDQNLQSTGAAVLTKDSVVENSGYPGIEYQPRPHDGTLQAECAEVVDPEFGSLDVDSLRNLAGQTSPVMTESGENRAIVKLLEFLQKKYGKVVVVDIMDSSQDPNIYNFEKHGFRNVDVRQEGDCLKLRTNVKNRDDFQRWREVFCIQTNTCFNSYKLFDVGVRKAFRQRLICLHGVKTHKGVRKTSTGCSVFMDATIKIPHRQAIKSDPLLKEFPCFVMIQGKHNHPLDSADVLNQLRIPSSTRHVFEKYFEQGMTVSMAHRHHLMKMELCDDLHGQANPAINPSTNAIAYMRRTWMCREYSGLNCPSMFEAIQKFGKDNPELTLRFDHREDTSNFCVALITPFMRRAHTMLREAGEVVFVDATGCVDQLNTSVIPFLCAGPAGAVPLAILVTSSQDEVTLTKGFGMIREALGPSAFNGRGEPIAFITDNSDAERKALAVTWPTSQRFLCIFHMLQQVWQWLLNSKNAIRKDHSQVLMADTKALLYADSTEDFRDKWENFQDSSLAMTYPNFLRYLSSLVQQKEEWAVAFRAGTILRGHHTNNFCEATMSIIKDIVLNRCKAYNTAQLVVFVAEIFDYYMRQRLIDVALKRRRVKSVNVGKVSLDAVESLGSGKFKVFVSTRKSRHWLAVLAMGEEKSPKEDFFTDLSEIENKEVKNDEEMLVLSEVKVESECEDTSYTNEYASEDQEAVMAKVQEATEALQKAGASFGNKDSIPALDRFIQCMKSIHSTNQFNSEWWSWSWQDPFSTRMCIPQ
ncbi:hypothetical protein Pmani_037594 [Petrolisthes manimaculis]|uniref:THAP-type domain-containing protein n=1 Tax=Petrolisthes manimaculis TaxID=1843537 RepID=A0AAE1TLC1_9EUCA|nr:hypothetical protein Pmani_037594 [Petrolisthes manimaculis]